MAARVSNRFFATNVKDGKSVSVILRSNSPLAQTVVNQGVCVPNWNNGESGANSPKVWVWSRVAGVTTAPSGVTWVWNGTPIVFDSNGYSTNFVQTVGSTDYPYFRTTTEVVEGISLPAIYIMRNIANSTLAETVNNTLTLQGTFTDSTGMNLDFAVNTSVRVQQSTQSGYVGVLTGTPRLTDDNNTASVVAKLYNNEGSLVTKSFYTEWFREGEDADDSPKYTGTATSQGGQYFVRKSFSKSDITDYAVIRVDFYWSSDATADTDKLCSAFFEIDDETDEMELQVTSEVFTGGVSGGSGQGDVMLRANQEVQWTFWMGHRQNPTEVYPGYSAFFVKLTDNKGNVISPSSIPTQESDPHEKATLAAYLGNSDTSDQLFKNVTTTLSTSDGDTVSGAGGKLKLSYQNINTWGDGIGGIILAV